MSHHPHRERPNLISHGLLLSVLYYGCYWSAQFRSDPDALIMIGMIWLIAGTATISYIFKLFRA